MQLRPTDISGVAKAIYFLVYPPYLGNYIFVETLHVEGGYARGKLVYICFKTVNCVVGKKFVVTDIIKKLVQWENLASAVYVAHFEQSVCLRLARRHLALFGGKLFGGLEKKILEFAQSFFCVVALGGNSRKLKIELLVVRIVHTQGAKSAPLLGQLIVSALQFVEPVVELEHGDFACIRHGLSVEANHTVVGYRYLRRIESHNLYLHENAELERVYAVVIIIIVLEFVSEHLGEFAHRVGHVVRRFGILEVCNDLRLIGLLERLEEYIEAAAHIVADVFEKQEEAQVAVGNVFLQLILGHFVRVQDGEIYSAVKIHLVELAEEIPHPGHVALDRIA